MKIILVGRKHAFAVELNFPVSVARVEVKDSGDEDLCDEISPEEDPNHPDYSGTVNAHLERRTDMEDAYGKSPVIIEAEAARMRPFSDKLGFGFGIPRGRS